MTPLHILGYVAIGAVAGLAVSAAGFCVFMCSGGADRRDEVML